MKLEFEVLESNISATIQRTKVPGGWLVLAVDDVLSQMAQGNVTGYEWRSNITFVPDPNYLWETEMMQPAVVHWRQFSKNFLKRAIRVPVEGGWLVKFRNSVKADATEIVLQSVTYFLPDPEHTWIDEKINENND